MQPKPWPVIPVEKNNFHTPPREYGILPFWFLNGVLDPEEMRFQLREFRAKGMPGIILHGRYGLETAYIGETYLDRIQFAVEEAQKLATTPAAAKARKLGGSAAKFGKLGVRNRRL